jgi:hypothetical protein
LATIAALVEVVTPSGVSQSYITTATNEVYNQTIYMPGTYSSGTSLYCSITTLPNSGFTVSMGDVLTGNVSATSAISFSIVTRYLVSASGKGGQCGKLLPTQLYTAGGQAISFRWTAPDSATYYIALYNPSSDSIEVSLTVYQVINTSDISHPSQQYATPTQTTHTPAVLSPNYTPASSFSLSNLMVPPNVIGAVVVATLIALVGGTLVYTFMNVHVVPPGKYDRRTRRVETSKSNIQIAEGRAEELLKNLEGLHRKGLIADEVYFTLKKDYEGKLREGR